MTRGLLNLQFIYENHGGPNMDPAEKRLVDRVTGAMGRLIEYDKRQTLGAALLRTENPSAPPRQEAAEESPIATLERDIPLIRLKYEGLEGKAEISPDAARLIRGLNAAMEELVKYHGDHKAPLPKERKIRTDG